VESGELQIRLENNDDECTKSHIKSPKNLWG